MKDYVKIRPIGSVFLIKLRIFQNISFMDKYTINIFFRKQIAFFNSGFTATPKIMPQKYNLQEKNMDSKFSGSVLHIFLFSIWAPLLLTITLCLATPFVICTVIRWICNHSTIGGKKYVFKGTAVGLFGRWILWFLLTIITLGIYGFWSTRNQIRWVIENIEVVN